MIEKYNQIIAIFDKERKQHDDAILDEKLIAAKKYYQNLLNYNDKLKATKENLEFNLHESEIEELEMNEQMSEIVNSMKMKSADKSSAFFDYLSSLEDQQDLLVANIQSAKSAFQSMYHQKVKLTQATEALSRRVEAKKLTLNKLILENRNLTDGNDVTQMTLDNKENQYRDVILIAAKLQKELDEKENSFVVNNENLDALKQELAVAKADLEIKQKELKETKKQIEQTEINFHKTVEQRKYERNKMSSVNQWKYGRSELANKIKKAKEEYFTVLANLDYVKKRDTRISDKIRSILGEEDNGDGESEIALKYLQAELNQYDDPKDKEINEEIQVEQQYNDQLSKELSLIEQSIKDFQGYKDQTIKSINLELEECSQNGYIKLLESEMNDLKSKIAQ
ncbi:hypothetical protein TRFO_29801 [Tritrichomonas foetus]|uniref:Uncharacterized protein n=1 Tax=Tritrichomonas foetus TaxID=1144522 RepID=A0A1J4JVD3_9EUKA|nr:hypothetical protein TRFO_29801 [Tritrichomonas foetus]|eukprot:OHT02971.1 hypothetical protein TRFO_29801 [Tritrichomonas foetus]